MSALVGWSGAARASSALEFPDNGVAQFSRGGAWVATATDPIAAHYNPGAMATQPTSFGLGANFVLQEICFDRRGPDGEAVGPGSGKLYTETCNSNAGNVNVIPNAAFVWRAGDKLAVGLAIVPPSSYGKLEWPDRSRADNPPPSHMPAPQRYLSIKTEGTILFPTLSAGYSITDQLHVGAGFIAGIALLELQTMSISRQSEDQLEDDFQEDNRSKVNAKDLFVPGFVVGALYEASKNLDLGLWYRWMDKIRAEGDLQVIATYYAPNGQVRTQCPEPNTDPVNGCAPITEKSDVAQVTLTIPMEARIGARWHMPRPAPTGLFAERVRKDPYPTRDPLRDDLYDLELDLTWANNSAADEVQIRFEPGISPIGLPGEVPTNADRPTGWKDSFGARLGGQYNVARNLAGVRLGTWIESSAIDEEYLTVTGVPALRGGFGGGFVVRAGAVDLEAGYQHMWNAGLDNNGDGKLKAIVGSGRPTFRSNHAVNGGSVKQHANVFSIGLVARL